jgi:tetratricopeptide (TPR) repeat protein
MHMLASEYPRAIEWGERALDLAGRLDAEAVTVHALNNVGTAYLNSGDMERGRAMLQESVQRALAANMPHDACRGRLNLGDGLASLDDYEAARATFEELHAYAARVGAALYGGSSLIELAHLDWIRGSWSASLARRHQILKWLERGQSQAYLEVIASTLFGRQHNDLGQAGAAHHILTGTLSKVRSFDELQMAASHLSELARALVALGLHDEALEIGQELVAAVKRGGYDSRLSALPLLSACYVLKAQADPQPLKTVLATMEDVERKNTRPTCRSISAALFESHGIRALQKNTPGQAIPAFRQAAGLWQELGRPYDQVRSLNELGQILISTGQVAEAREVIDQAHGLVESLAAQLEDFKLKSSFLNTSLVQEIGQAQDALTK